ncbi:MAG: hypothetical protein ACREQW_23500 [Candidatus Binatia bacterium]
MKRNALVALKSHDQADQALPCLQDVVKAGMQVTFLLPYPVERWRYLRDHWVEAETAREAVSAGRKLLESYSWESQTALAAQKLSSIRSALQKQDVDVEIQLYAGSLRKALQDRLCRGDIDWVMTRAQTADRLRGLLAVGVAPFGWFKRPRHSSVWLLYPATIPE